MKKLALHWWILLAMAAGIAYGVVAAQLGATDHVLLYIRPLGTLFLNLLKMIAVPLVLFSLVAGVASLNDTSKLGRIGGRTIALYLGTTALAITIGLLVASIIQPGASIAADPQIRAGLQANFGAEASVRLGAASQVSILDQMIDIVPTNPFAALASASMLQVVFFALILGVALTRLGARAAPAVQVFQLLTDGIIEIVHIVMRIAPIGVFALMAALIADLGRDPDSLSVLLGSLLGYMATVAIGLLVHVLVVYCLLLKFVAKVPIRHFFRAIAPAQLLAFSTSSSAATLPVTMSVVEEKVGVSEEVSSFVLPLGATINMDGTGLYQGVAAMFIATAYGLDLTLSQQLQVVLTASLASIGTAAVPGVGIVMLTIVLGQIGIAPEGIALILGVDRPLDMLRTAVNVTGDATVATCVAAKEGALEPTTASLA
jgi:proton glutamate symport protein